MLLRTFISKSFCLHTFLLIFLLGIYLRVELLAHKFMLHMRNFCFSKSLYPFPFMPAMYKSFNFSTFLPVFVVFPFIVAILVSIKSYLIVVSICIFLMATSIDHLFIHLLAIKPSEYLW